MEINCCWYTFVDDSIYRSGGKCHEIIKDFGWVVHKEGVIIASSSDLSNIGINWHVGSEYELSVYLPDDATKTICALKFGAIRKDHSYK